MSRKILYFSAAVLAVAGSGALRAAEPVRAYLSDSDQMASPASYYRAGDGGCEAGCAAVGDAGCEAAAGCAGPAAACDARRPASCYLCGPDEPLTLLPELCSGWLTVGGWVQAGYHNKTTPLAVRLGDGASLNDVPHHLNVHQLWLYAEKQAVGDCGWDWGFRVDFVYGTDAQKTQGFGGADWDNTWDYGVYGWALPQLYGEMAFGDLSIKAGHFYTPVGYETVPAPNNFFYSHALTMFNSEPFTHTGVLATYKVNDWLEGYGGWTAGWDTGFEIFSGGSVLLGGFSLSLTDDLSLTYIATAGDLGARGDDAYSHSIVVDWSVTDRLNYVLQSDLLAVDSTGEDDLGINQYLIYRLNDCWAVGGRMEWWKNEGVSHYEFTHGLNYKPHANVTLRPELRYHWVPGTDFDQTIFGMDAIVTF